ncbi:haloacid dehalogenase-like hydrolase [Streptomyces sp. NPDC007083]|uniref:haloacid dehalogenase-like hydrolase n=1 Tax=Streptomyces sp. NPDC007083 TaxID=3156913 RepID=UPI0033E71A64
MSALHVFDLDGTLHRRRTAAELLGEQAGCGDHVTGLEERLSTGGMDHITFAAVTQMLWGGRLTSEHSRAAFAAADWLEGVTEVLEDIRHRGEHAVVVTMGPDLFARYLEPWVDEVHATPYPAPPSSTPLDVSQAPHPEYKIEAVRSMQLRMGIAPEVTVAYGDGPSDLELWAADEVGISVAINPSAGVPKGVTDLTFEDCQDLRVPYQGVRERLAARAKPAHATAA